MDRPLNRKYARVERSRARRRYSIQEQGWTWAIDVWEEPEGTAGTILAEVECPDDESLAAITLPRWARLEVTADTSYSAITLAHR